MRIEFLGISGVGKTFVATRYCRQLRENKVKFCWFWMDRFSDKGWVIRNFLKFFVVAKEVLVLPTWCWQLRHYLISKEIKDAVGKLRLFFNGVFLKYAIDEMKEYEGISIFDEGVAQYILAVHLRTDQQPSKDEIHRIMRMFGYPERIIVIDAHTQTVARRLNTRGRRAEILKASDQIVEIERMKRVMEIIVSALTENSNIQIERIMNEEQAKD